MHVDLHNFNSQHS